MRHERKASLLFLISLLAYLALSGVLALILGVVVLADPNAKIDDLTFLLNALMVSLPAFFVPAVIFRRATKMPAFKAPGFTHILMAIGIGIGCLMLNQSLSSLTGAIFYNSDLNSLSTTSESVTELNDLNMIFSLALIPPLSEEFLMRGTLLESWRKASPLGAMLLTSALFALLHAAPTSIPVYFAIGMLLAAVYMITRNVWLTVIIHLVNNLGSVIGALILKYSSGILEQPEVTAVPGGISEIVYLVMIAFVYALGAAAVLVPLMLGLNAVYKKRRLGMYAPSEYARTDGDTAESAAEGTSYEIIPAPGPADAVPEEKVGLLADPFLWIAIVILIAINIASSLVALGIIDFSAVM